MSFDSKAKHNQIRYLIESTSKPRNFGGYACFRPARTLTYLCRHKRFEPLYFPIIWAFCKVTTVFLLCLRVITAYKTVELRARCFLLFIGNVSVDISCHSYCWVTEQGLCALISDAGIIQNSRITKYFHELIETGVHEVDVIDCAAAVREIIENERQRSGVRLSIYAERVPIWSTGSVRRFGKKNLNDITPDDVRFFLAAIQWPRRKRRQSRKR